MSYTRIKYMDIRVVTDGDVVKWVGVGESGDVLMHTVSGKRYVFNRSTIKRDTPVVRKLARMDVDSDHNWADTWTFDGWMDTLRVAAIFGVGPGLRGVPGIGQTPDIALDMEHTMGYDIETEVSNLPYGIWPPVSCRITSLAVWCTCGYSHAWTTEPIKTHTGVTCVLSSEILVASFITRVVHHAPMWLVGHNCYGFDNRVIAYHTPAKLERYLRIIPVGGTSAGQYAFLIDIPGVYNVDTYVHISKTSSGAYPNHKLDTIVRAHGIGEKMKIGDIRTTRGMKLIEYNAKDSEVTARLWKVLSLDAKVVSIAAVSCAPVVDCVRYVSGKMSAAAWASNAIKHGYLVDWGACHNRAAIKGGEVLTPVTGLHRDVYTLDFESMYPTIHIAACLSMENFTRSKVVSDDVVIDSVSLGVEAAVWDESSWHVNIDGRVMRVEYSDNAVAPTVLRKLVSERRIVKRSDPAKAYALKVLANSLYGSEGHSDSPIHCPSVAAAVTFWGRWSLSVAHLVLERLGCVVVYGDTDSCFVKLRPRLRANMQSDSDIALFLDSALAVLHRVLWFTPMRGMRMTRDVVNNVDKSHYKSLLLVGPKMYCYVAEGDVMPKYKGVTPVRRDRIGIVKSATIEVIEILLSDKPIQELQRTLGNRLRYYVSRVTSGELRLGEVSKTMKVGGEQCYVYTGSHGEERSIPVHGVDEARRVPYSHTAITLALASAVGQLTLPASLGNLETLLKHSDELY